LSDSVAENGINSQNRVKWIWKFRSWFMNAVLSPIVSEFETQEQADSYEVWLLQKLERAENSIKPNIPHDQVMAKMNALLGSKRLKHAA
jgi:hypothetical protein